MREMRGEMREVRGEIRAPPTGAAAVEYRRAPRSPQVHHSNPGPNPNTNPDPTPNTTPNTNPNTNPNPDPNPNQVHQPAVSCEGSQSPHRWPNPPPSQAPRSPHRAAVGTPSQLGKLRAPPEPPVDYRLLPRGAEPEEFPFGPPLAVANAEPPAAHRVGFSLQRAAAARGSAPSLSQSPRRGGKKGGKDVFTSLLR